MTCQQFLLTAVCALVLIGCASPDAREKTVDVPPASSAEIPSTTPDIPPLPGLGSLSR
jgi:hypothetical protein